MAIIFTGSRPIKIGHLTAYQYIIAHHPFEEFTIFAIIIFATTTEQGLVVVENSLVVEFSDLQLLNHHSSYTNTYP